MLGTRTKKIYSYGKRTQRVVDASENRKFNSIFGDEEPSTKVPIASKMRKREHPVYVKSRTPSPKVVRIHRKKKIGSPVLPSQQSPLNAKIARLAQILDSETPARKGGFSKKVNGTTPSRTPLAPFSLNTLRSPVASGKLPKSKALGVKRGSSKLNKPFSPFVDVDIIVLDEEGTTIKQERRVSRTDIQPNSKRHVSSRQPGQAFDRTKTSVPSQVQMDSEEDDVEPLKHAKRRGARSALVIYSDDSEAEDFQSSPPRYQDNTSNGIAYTIGNSHTKVTIPAPQIPLTSHIHNKLSTPPKPRHLPLVHERYLPSSMPITPVQYYLSPAPRPRQLTPIRARASRNRLNSSLLPSPSTLTDLDLSLEIEALNIVASSQLNEASSYEVTCPEYLGQLLAECGQSACGPIEFSSFIDTFPFDPIVKLDSHQPSDLQFDKIGEASYSEVFGIGDVVLKVIPLSGVNGGHAQPWDSQDLEEDGPYQSDAKDVMKEIIVTHAMGEMCNGFVKLLKAYIVKGKYPEVLLRLWDVYATTKGSESTRPDKFLVSQTYAIIVLPNGGPDLDTYKFVNTSKTGWRQACSIFWQVAKSLAHAEQLVSFEHRDLHLSQILIKDLSMSETLPLQPRSQNSKTKARKSRVFMDDLTHGVRTTLIDLGLSRMDAGDGNGGEMIHWTAFEDEVFTGEGDYQFDIYRMMREHNGDKWEEFKPLTNVMWLHYLALKLLQSKRLKAPSSRPSVAHNTAVFTEKDCYDCLTEIESWLRDCLAPFIPSRNKSSGKGRKKVQPPPPSASSAGPVCAGEIVAYAEKRGWIQSK